MGQFSWMYADTNNEEALLECGEGFLVLPHGEYLHEGCYDGYGNFDGQDVYELVAEWNRAYLAAHPEFEIPVHGDIPMPDGSIKKMPPIKVSKHSWYKAYADLTLTKEEVELAADCPFRNIGIDIACYDDQNAKLPYPIKVCKHVPYRPEELPASEGDPNQGWGEPDEEEDEDGEEYEPSRSEYTVELNYGYQRSYDTYETYHAFELTDHADGPGDDVMAAYLAEQLDTTPDDEDFDWNMMDVALPQATVSRIQRGFINQKIREAGGPYEAYQIFKLWWMIEHGFTLDDLAQRMKEIQYADPEDSDQISTPADELFAQLEDDTGFDGEIWPCYREFLENEYKEVEK